MPEPLEPSVAEVEEFLILNLGRQLHSQLGIGRHGIIGEVINRYPKEPKPEARIVAEAIWGLVARGLAYIDFSNDSGMNSGLHANPKS